MCIHLEHIFDKMCCDKYKTGLCCTSTVVIVTEAYDFLHDNIGKHIGLTAIKEVRIMNNFIKRRILRHFMKLGSL
jgi:hypothetical protein